MKIKIGKRYEETKQNLRDRIRSESISTTPARTKDRMLRYACYFCSEQIIGQFKILNDDDKKFFIDNRCYQDAKEHYYDNGVRYSIN